MLQHTAQQYGTFHMHQAGDPDKTLQHNKVRGGCCHHSRVLHQAKGLCGRLPLNSRRGKLKSDFYPKSQTQGEGISQKTSMNWSSSHSVLGLTENSGDQEVPAPRHSEIPKTNPNSASQGHASPPTVIFKSSLLCRAILHPPSLLIRPDLQMSASFQLSQHNCHI